MVTVCSGWTFAGTLHITRTPIVAAEMLAFMVRGSISGL
jgi:hypothetical protein